MLEPSHNDELPVILGKRYFTIGEVSELCAVKPHVLRYWEQEFPQLNPVKRRGNRRYYQRQDVLMIRQIRALLYDQGFTIGGARLRLSGDEAKDDTTQYKQMIRQMIAELERCAGGSQEIKAAFEYFQFSNACAIFLSVLRGEEQLQSQSGRSAVR